ncbi:MAG TPA: DUF4286 family protein [Flavipsychrobacter sp.]
MVLYNVTIKINHEAEQEWLQWMKEEHMPELMATGLFVESRLFRLLDVDESDGITYAAQYYCKNMIDYDNYISEHSAEMRAKGLERFGDKFIAFRTLMELV